MEVKRLRKQIPPGTARKLWVQSGGRCQYRGCNSPLWQDELMSKDMNKAYISHIIAASPKGPRGHEEKSIVLELAYDNLMLLCDECHNRIDEADQEYHTVEMLTAMKQEHETRINIVTGIMEAERSLVVSYLARIGGFYPSLKKNVAFQTIIPGRFPYRGYFIEGGTRNSPIVDHEHIYWETETIALERWFSNDVLPHLDGGSCNHLSVFALAPQPLLIKLGALLSELRPVDIYQYFRSPGDSWQWQQDSSDLSIQFVSPENLDGHPVLKIELSAPVHDSRVTSVFDGTDLSIYTLRIAEPRRDFIKSKYHLEELKRAFRSAYDQINSNHPAEKTIHVFPVMPNAAAVEFGRVRMPKADKGLLIYDQSNKQNSFIKTLTIS
ncbi:HNH endonuclease [Pedobacter sp. G11]|uniref:SAVED domain-containing protein n=1 Tax=Pedobacter sp. G11 TaxID=2482728 RepID=UPI000F5EAC04|nr:SAVED domain-containing protein [Pedobacter sp. G11]AZI26464.1 HNH endonuclease [Pedobacter sp. G11]